MSGEDCPSLSNFSLGARLALAGMGRTALHYSINTGKPAFEHLFGQGLFEYYLDPEAAKTASNSKASISSRASNSLLANYDFSGISYEALQYFLIRLSTIAPLLSII